MMWRSPNGPSRSLGRGLVRTHTSPKGRGRRAAPVRVVRSAPGPGLSEDRAKRWNVPYGRIILHRDTLSFDTETEAAGGPDCAGSCDDCRSASRCGCWPAGWLRSVKAWIDSIGTDTNYPFRTPARNGIRLPRELHYTDNALADSTSLRAGSLNWCGRTAIGGWLRYGVRLSDWPCIRPRWVNSGGSGDDTGATGRGPACRTGIDRKLERRTDMYLSTLRRFVEAMGGDLDIVVRFPDQPLCICGGLGTGGGGTNV